MLAVANGMAILTLNPTQFYAVLAVAILGMLALLFTSYRKVVGYFLTGMAYWLMVEGLAWGLRASFSLESLNSYVFAVGLSFIPIMMLLIWVENRQETLTFSLPKTLPKLNKAKTTATRPSILMAGQRPFMLEQDTDFCQHFIRHSPVFDYE